MIRIQNISYVAGGKSILKDVTCDLPRSGLTVLLGPNGAGKSTLLGLLCGDKKPTGGDIFLHGRSIRSLSTRELAIQRAVLTQHHRVELPFTCAEIVMMGRYPHFSGKPAVSDQFIVQTCMQEMNVWHLAGRSFPGLSGGEQQRVQIARILAQLSGSQLPASKKILFLDEPISAMDLLHQQLTLQKAKELSVLGYTVVVVLHDLNLASQFADLLILLKQGRLLAMGRPREVLHPRTIQEAYGIRTRVVYPEGYGHAVIIPDTGLINNSPINTNKHANNNTEFREG